MDDQTIETMLRSGDETAPAALRERIRALVRDEPVLHDVDVSRRRSRRTTPVLVAAVTVVLLIGGIIGMVRLRSTPTPPDPTVSTNPDNAPTTTAPPATTAPSTTVLDLEAARLDGLPASDPVTLTRRPGELWPMSDLLTGGDNGYRGFWAGEERNGDETIRTVSYVGSGTRCSLDLHPPASGDVAETAVPPDCRGAIVVQARLGVPQPSTPTTPTIPVTGGGEIWTYQSNDPGALPLCLESRACTSPITLERRIDDVPVTITFTDGIPETMLDETPEPWDAASYIQLAQSIYLYDEATGQALPHGSFKPRNIDPTTEFAWFRGTSSGPLVAVTDDGHELRVRNDGDVVSFYIDGVRQTHYTSGGPEHPENTDPSSDMILQFGWDWSLKENGYVAVFGMTDPAVVEVEFQATNGEVFVAATDDRSGMFHHQFFVLTMPWGATIKDDRGVLILAKDAAGNMIGRYGADHIGGFG